MYNVLRPIFLIFPPYAFGGGLIAMTTNQVQSELMSQYNSDSYKHPLSWDILGLHICIMLSEAVIFHFLHLMIEFGWFDCFYPR